MVSGKPLVTALAIVLLGSGVARADDKLGRVTFPTSCDATVQAEFETGVAMLHSYWFGAAGKTFQSVLQKDPKCAMAYWGIAVDLAGDTLEGPPSAINAQAAWAALEKARATGAGTPRERDWIEAISAYYRDHDKVPNDARLDAYDAAMEQMTQKYPDDVEARVFHALTLLASAPKNDVRYASQIKSAAILEKLYEQNPRHPGVTHYLILAYDAPGLADRGLAAARRYPGIAGDAPDARHAPSHTYSTLGFWEESISANASALEIQPDNFHALDFSVYAALQRAQDGRAKTMIDRAPSTRARGDRPLTAEDSCALAAMPARHALERMDWIGAAALPVKPSPYPQADALTRFARGLGMALVGNVAGARREIEAMDALRAALKTSDQGYWADRSEEQTLTISAWVALAEGDRPQALRLMRAAADSEDAHIRNPLLENRLYPMRELLAEMLAEIGQPGPALQEFETALSLYPNRYRGLWGATLTAAATGQRKKAFDYIDQFVAMTGDADALRPEIARARAFVAKR